MSKGMIVSVVESDRDMFLSIQVDCFYFRIERFSVRVKRFAFCGTAVMI